MATGQRLPSPGDRAPHPEANSPGAAAIEAWLVSYIAEMLGVEPASIDVRRPFTYFGLSSAEAVILAGDLEMWLGGRHLPATLAWDFPTIEALARQLAAGEFAGEEALEVRREARQGAVVPIAIIGIGCRFPGAANPQTFWQLLRGGIDAITEVPRDRWDVDAFYDPDPAKPGKMSTRWGGFLDQVDYFEPHFFG